MGIYCQYSLQVRPVSSVAASLPLTVLAVDTHPQLQQNERHCRLEDSYEHYRSRGGAVS